jgi:hypothetical protein
MTTTHEDGIDVLDDIEEKRGGVPRVPPELLAQLPVGQLRGVLGGAEYEPTTDARDALLEKYQARLLHRPEFKVLTTSTPDKGKPILGWFFYKEAFASALVQQLVRDARLPGDAFVLDPFGGIGTVPFVCQALGVRATSIDLSPLPVFIANVKMHAARSDAADELLALGAEVEAAIRVSSTSRELPDVSIWTKAFDNDVAHGLFDALEAIQRLRHGNSYSTSTCDVAHLALLCVAEEVSHTVKDGTSLRLREPGRRLGRAGVTKSLQDLALGFRAQVQGMSRDVRSYRAGLLEGSLDTPVQNESRQGDARQMSELFKPCSVDLVVTSPPYPNRYDYSAIYAIELLLGFVRNRDELRSLRFDLFRSHLEAPWPSDVRGLTPAVEEVLCCLYVAGMSSPRVFKMILGYFADIAATLEQLMIVMKPNAMAHFVVGNVRIEGQEVPVDLMLAEIAEGLGFRTEAVSVARYKGTNSQQSRKFGAGRLRESIVTFRKV